jgi:hypothetical protein
MGHHIEDLDLNPLFTAVSHDDIISQLNYILNKDLQKWLIKDKF